MAKIRILPNAEFAESLRDKFAAAEERLQKVKTEIEACRCVYQGINQFYSGGLDAGLLTNYLFSPATSEAQELAFEGLDLIRAILFLHSKFCISEPVVTATPLNQDTANVRAAESAQNYIPYLRKHTNLADKLERGPYLDTVVDGSGVFYIGWDTDAGEGPIGDLPEDPEELMTVDIKMEGDLDFRPVAIDKFYIDAAAEAFEMAEHCFEELEMPIEKLLFKCNEDWQQELIIQQAKNSQPSFADKEDPKNKRIIKVYEYWEKGTPWNGFLGCYCLFIDPKNPKILKRKGHPYGHRKLPFALTTDIDIPRNPYGMSRIVYAYQVQKSIDMLISMILDNAQLHGTAKFLYPEGSVSDDAFNNSAATGIPYNPSTGSKPDWFRPASVTPDAWKGVEMLRQYIWDVYGMSEFSQGKIPRELSSYAVQLSLETDDKFRIRMFNKKKAFLRDIYVQGLELTKQFMNDARKLRITGVEGRSDSVYFSASDLIGDYDLDVDYGQYIPVDPAARKQQLLEFVKNGFYEKAGGDMKKLATLLVDGSMLNVKSAFENAVKRQQTENDKMTSGQDVAIKPWDNDEAHLAAIDEFTSTETFEKLPPEIQGKIWKHGEEHTNRLAEKLAKSQAGAGGGGEEPGAPGALPPEEPPAPVRPRATLNPVGMAQPNAPVS